MLEEGAPFSTLHTGVVWARTAPPTTLLCDPPHHHTVLGDCSHRAIGLSRMQGPEDIRGPSRTFWSSVEAQDKGSSFKSPQGHQTNALFSLSLSLSLLCRRAGLNPTTPRSVVTRATCWTSSGTPSSTTSLPRARRTRR